MKRILIPLLALASVLPLSAATGKDTESLVLLDSTSVTVSPSGSGTFAIYRSIRAGYTRDALKQRIIRFDYDPLTAAAEFDFVRIHKADGTTRDIDVSQAVDYAAPAHGIYWGARQIMIGVGHLDPGDIVEYKIDKKGFTYALLAEGPSGLGSGPSGAVPEEDERFIPPMRGEFYDIVPFWCDMPTRRKVYRLSIPMEKEIQFRFYQGECSSSMTYEDGRKVYTFAKDGITPFKGEPNMVHLFDAAPKLMLSSTPEWKDKSLWFNRTNEDYGSFHAYAPAQKKVDELIRGKKTEMDKIAVLTHWVADNIRYAGITMGKGEGYTLHRTEMNWTDRCGVCKDIAGTLISLLRMAGFEAYPAMTMAGSRVEAIPADHFNHCVAVVKLSDGTYMPLDPTWVPFCRELWSSAEQQQNYLPGVPEGSGLCLTPVSAPENHYFRLKAESRIDEQGNLKGSFTLCAEGQTDRRIRSIFTNGWQSEWQNAMEREILAISSRAVLKEVDWGKDPKDYQAAPIRITFKFEIPGYALTSGNAIVFKPLTMNGIYSRARSWEGINTQLSHRQYGWKDACSRLVEIDETVHIPEGWTLSNPREDRHESAPADFNGYIRQDGSTVTLHQQLILRKRVYDAADWDGFRTAVNTYKQYKKHLTLEK